MNKTEHLQNISKQHQAGTARGICSICTANELVIEAAMEKAGQDNSFLLIESTCNQVNQYGGYTGMTPADFQSFICKLAVQTGFPRERIILGGDHLGPNPWKDEKAAQAMEKACRLVEDYVLAGYTKIHLDTSMFLADDPGDRTEPLASRLIARRGAELALRAEKAYQELKKENPEAEPPLYVIGTEVPVPGGTGGGEHEVDITSPADLNETLQMFKNYFQKEGLTGAWERIIAVVVQPGVEFGTGYIIEYDRSKAAELSRAIHSLQGLVFEAHSTDYQTLSALKEMVADGFCILKVGPALTFTLREALFSLTGIEQELAGLNSFTPSKLVEVLDKAMLENPGDWQNYYQGSAAEQEFQRKYSLSDRVRYYWAMPEVQQALDRLIANLESIEIPLTLISQYLPQQYAKIRKGLLTREPLALVKDRIKEILEDYAAAAADSKYPAEDC